MTYYCEKIGATCLPAAYEATGKTSSLASFDKTDQQLVALAQAFGVTSLVASTSRIVALAQYVESNKITLRINKIIYGGERLYGVQKEFVCRALQTAEVCGLLGSAETGVWGFMHNGLPADVFLYHPVCSAVVHIAHSVQEND
jgi:hypothetical protein